MAPGEEDGILRHALSHFAAEDEFLFAIRKTRETFRKFFYSMLRRIRGAGREEEGREEEEKGGKDRTHVGKERPIECALHRVAMQVARPPPSPLVL